MLHDLFSRKFNYLRLSVTEACNFRCRYCLPEGYRRSDSDELRFDEIERLLIGAAAAGFQKVRFTGGEPTIRKDLLQMIEAAYRTGAFQQIAVSTNGWNLKRLARGMREAGVHRLNVSVDSLDPARFQELTGRSELDSILAGIEESLGLGFERIKLNAVLHAGTAAEELERFLLYVKSRPVSVRFIELMRTGNRPEYRERHYLSSGSLRLALLQRGWSQRSRQDLEGPAVEFRHPDFQGSIGLIAPHAEGFCESCNRLRVTSRGRLRLCLFGEEEFSLRPHLQDLKGAMRLRSVLSDLLVKKPRSHFLPEQRSGLTGSFSQVGG